MLTLEGFGRKTCDGVSRREFLTLGALTVGGVTLRDVLAAEAQAGIKNSHKAVIMIYLPGGPAHQDTFDLKMDAPSDIRGEFKPIPTNVPGIQITEHLPRMAKMMDKFAVIRSLVGARDEHANPLCLTGYPMADRQRNHPSLGSSIARVFPAIDSTVPQYVDLIPKTQHPPYCIPAATGFLGRSWAGARMDEESARDRNLKGLTMQRLADRRKMLERVDHLRREIDNSDLIQSADVATQQAFTILTSSKLAAAMDVSKVDAKTKERYGSGYDKVVGDACVMNNLQFNTALRMVEAGCRCVTMGYGFWDWHGNNFGELKKYLPILDQGLTSLVQDIHDRGLNNDVSVVVWGDFGRTPKINKDAGRDHWPAVNMAMLAGGGMKTGQLIGTTTKDGAYVDERPIQHADVMSTLLYKMGFDTRHDMTADQLSRPVFLYPDREPVSELI